MASKRDLKRRINYICSDLFAECVAASLYGTSEYKETAEATLTSLLFMHRNYVRRISHPEPGMTKKAAAGMAVPAAAASALHSVALVQLACVIVGIVVCFLIPSVHKKADAAKE